MKRAKFLSFIRKHKSGRAYWNYMGLLIVLLFGEIAYEEWASHRIKLYDSHWK